jgi:hypothetical protein
MRRLLVVVFAASAMTFASGCGGGSSSNPASPSVSYSVDGSVLATYYQSRAVNITKSGTLTLTLTWPSSAVNLDLYLSESSCRGYPPTSCTVLASSKSTTGTRESLSYNVTSGQTYIACVDSMSRSDSSYTLQLSIP